MAILTTTTGRAFKKRYFIECWSRAIKRQGSKLSSSPRWIKAVKLHFHDLRGTTVTLLLVAGCTHQQIATITGHTLKTVYEFWTDTSPEQRTLQSKLSPILRTQREQILQTACKPPLRQEQT